MLRENEQRTKVAKEFIFMLDPTWSSGRDHSRPGVDQTRGRATSTGVPFQSEWHIACSSIYYWCRHLNTLIQIWSISKQNWVDCHYLGWHPIPLSTVEKHGATLTLRDTAHFSLGDQFGPKCSQAGWFFISLNNSVLVFCGGGGELHSGYRHGLEVSRMFFYLKVLK